MGKLQVGDKAPQFSGDSDGTNISLANYAGKKNVVLYFYPGDFTPVCTREACGFRDIYEELQGADTEIIGVSTDNDESHKKFTAEYKLPFPLLADKGKVIARSYNASNLFADIMGKVARITYVIGKDGKIAAILKSELSANKHVEGVKQALAALK